MSTANTGADKAPDNNKCIDFTQRTLMEALQRVIATGLKQAEFTSRSDKNKYVMIYASGRMVFYTRARYNGKRPRIELGEISTHSLEQIHQTYLEVRKNIADGIDPRLIRRRDMTYASFFDQVYISDRQNNDKKSLKADLSRDQHWLRPRFGEVRLTAIHNRMALDLVTEMRAAGKAVSTIRNVVSLLKSVLQLAVDMDMLSAHPIKYRPPVAAPKQHKVYPQVDELEAFVREAMTCKDDEYSAARMWALSALTGARSGEVMDAKVSDFEIDTGIWRLPDQKSGKPGIIFLSAPARQVVQELLAVAPGDHLIPGLRGNARIARPVKLFKRICKRAGVGLDSSGEVVWTPHMLRHGFATVAAMAAQIPDLIVSRALRHSSPDITRKVYIHDDQQALRAANDAVGSLLMPMTGTDSR
ncbi:MAG: integrase family protein [Proteobacteria bacterium]|nr:integrase family protein [Pseudomonadota bacterium]